MKRTHVYCASQSVGDAPTISVITVCLNPGRYIRQTIESVRAQSYPAVEHIVVDGGSTDGTLDVLREVEGSYNIRWASEADRGLGHAFNKGIARARGEWLYFLNADDYLLDADALRRVMDYVSAHPGWSVYMGHIRGVDSEGEETAPEEPPFGRDLFTHEVLLNEAPTVVHQGTFYAREVFERVGGYDESYRTHMDYEFHLRLTRKYDIKAMELVVAGLRAHADAKSQQPHASRFVELYRARRDNGGRLVHPHTLYFLRGYLRSAPWSRTAYRKMVNSRLGRWLLRKAGLNGFDW